MIIKGTSRSGPGGLAAHLGNAEKNERVQLLETRGTVAQDLRGALIEMDAYAAGSRCEKPLYHGAISPEPPHRMTHEQIIEAVDALEKKLGLEGHARVIVLHEKEGREHIHPVWSRIALTIMRAVHDGHNYRKHEEVARDLERRFGHDRVQGAHAERDGIERPDRTPSRAELRQEERTGITGKQVKQEVSALFRTSDGPEAFRSALAEHGYAYGRALKLINPVEQLGIVVRDSARDLKKWARRADRAYALVPEPEQRRKPMEGEVVSDVRRTQFFHANDGWDRVARQAINYATSYARYFAEQGDHEVSSSALNALLQINADYIATKGTTFFNNVLLMENPLVTDGIINTTLEALRQTMQIALARGDERQATQTLEAMAALVRLYLQINYPGVGGAKTHAHLAVGYLSGALESVVPHKMVDVLMRGIQLLGSSATAMIVAGATTDSTSAIDKIGALGAVGVVGDPFRPVLLTAIDQLSEVTFLLLRVRGQQLSFTFGRTLSSVALLAKLLLATPDVPLSSIHSSNLGPYFSSTSQTSLRSKLTQLVNALNEEKAVGAMPRDILANVATWSDDLPRELKELLLLAIQNRSAFSFDLIAWITGVVEILIAASQAPAAEHVREKLQRTALRIVWVLTWVPTDRETAAFVETWGMTNNLFAMMEDALRRDSVPVFEAARKMLLDWAVKAGAHPTNWGILERALTALCADALGDDERRVWVMANLPAALDGDEAPDVETRSLAARSMRRAANEYRQPDFIIDRIEYRLASAPYEVKRDFLREVANVVHPVEPGETKGGPFVGGDAAYDGDDDFDFDIEAGD